MSLIVIYIGLLSRILDESAEVQGAPVVRLWIARTHFLCVIFFIENEVEFEGVLW